MIWNKEQTKALTDRVLSFSKAEQTFVAVNGSDRASLRFARNTATTSGATSGTSVAITASFGKRSGTVTASQFDDASLQRALRNAEEIAKVSPENPEAMPFLGPQTYSPVNAYFDDAANASPDWRASSVETAIGLSKKKDVVSAGFVETQSAMQAVASSQGLFGYDRFTAADYNLTARTPDGSGSGWASKSFNELRLLQPASLADDGDRQGRAGEESLCDRAWQVHRHPRTCRDRRPPRVHDLLCRRAAGRRRTQLLSRRRAAATASVSRLLARRSTSTRIPRTRSRRRSRSTTRGCRSLVTSGSKRAS